MKTSKLFQTMSVLVKNLAKHELLMLKDIIDNLCQDAQVSTPLVKSQEVDLVVSDESLLIEKFGYLPSTYQLALIDWLTNNEGNAIVSAVAGAGKSSSLKMLAKVLESDMNVSVSDIKVLVFGKQNQIDLVTKFGSHWGDSVSTLHSCGWNLIKKELNMKGNQGKVTGYKYKNIARDLNYYTKQNNGYMQLNRVCDESDFFKLVDLIRLKRLSISTDSISELVYEYALECVHNIGVVSNAIRELLNAGDDLAYEQKIFDFVDQLYLPLHWKLHEKANFKKFKFVLVDECQDLNACQTELVLALKADDGRIMSVGDNFQSILGFAGASADSFQKLKKATNAIELPLSVCYRCPKAHIALVNKIFPEIKIESFEKNEKGTINKITNEEVENLLQNGDIVLCRKTAPLVNLCIQLISTGVPAKVKGRDIGEMLKKDLADIEKLDGFSFTNFNFYLDKFSSLKVDKVANLDNAEELIEKIKDKKLAIKTIYTSQIEAKSINDLCNYIDSLFSDDIAPITLMTVHKAKGSEADRIFILEPESMPLIFKASKDWQIQQEYNLLYVALTRAKKDLFLIINPDKKKQPSWLPNI